MTCTDDVAAMIERLRKCYDPKVAAQIPGGYYLIHTSDLVDAMDMLARLQKEREWRPIESAPKDGTAILLYCPKFYFGAGVYVGWWGGNFFEVCTEGATAHPYSDDGATHWKHFPSAPEAQP